MCCSVHKIIYIDFRINFSVKGIVHPKMLINNNEHHVPNLIDLQNKKLITSAVK